MRFVGRVLAALAVLALTAWAAAVGFLWFGESRIVFRNQWTKSWAALDADGSTSPVELMTSDGFRLEAVAFAPRPPADTNYWILFFNGAAGSIHRRQQRQQLEQLHALGYNVLAFDYRGFGRNDGQPSEAGLYSDAAAAYRYLTTVRRIPPGRVILAGRSLGSAVAVEMAVRAPAAGLLLFSAIDSIPLMGARLYPWAPVRLLVSNRFDSLSKIGDVRVPVVVVHARNDRFVPISVGRALYERARGRKRFVDTLGGHNRAGFSPLDELTPVLTDFWPVEEASAGYSAVTASAESPVPSQDTGGR